MLYASNWLKKTSPLYILMKNGEDILYFITAEFAWPSTVMWATNFLMATIVLSYSECNIYSNQHYSVSTFIMTLFVRLYVRVSILLTCGKQFEVLFDNICVCIPAVNSPLLLSWLVVTELVWLFSVSIL